MDHRQRIEAMEKLANLRRSGHLSNEEFNRAKERVIGLTNTKPTNSQLVEVTPVPAASTEARANDRSSFCARQAIYCIRRGHIPNWLL